MSDFEINEGVLHNEIPVIAVSGDVDFGVAPQLKRAISGRIDGGDRQLVVDLSGTDFIDSTAIGVLVGARKRLSDAGGSLAVICDNETIRGIFETVGLENVIALHRCTEDAMASLAHAA